MKKTIHYYQREHATFLGRLARINREIPALRESYNSFAREMKMPLFGNTTLKRMTADTALHFCEREIVVAVEKQHNAVKRFFLEEYYRQFNGLKKRWEPIDRTINQMSSREREAFASATYANDGSVIIDREASLPFFEVTIESKEDFELMKKYEAAADAWNAFLDHIQKNGITTNNIHKATFAQLFDTQGVGVQRAKKKPEILF